jgi:L-alanine-DL-glutamate epimerase-like enolase superfamily enzyme
VDVPWWDDMVVGAPKKIVENGFIAVPDKPGLGVDDYNDEVLREHLHPDYPALWAETSRWDDVYSHDRLWS